MAVKRLSAETLIAIALDTLKTEVGPALPPDKRYTLAMVQSALEIARRELLVDGDSAEWKLLDEIYDDGEGSPTKLAADIRRGAVSEAKHKGLHDKLRALVVDELKIKNPRFLASRGIPT